MNDSTTEQANTPAAETPPPPPWPENVEGIPIPSDVPRDSAADTARIAAHLLALVIGYRERIRPHLEATPPTVDTAAVWQAADTRRRVAVVADMIARRKLSVGGTMDAQHALRLAERIAGLTLAAGQRAGVVRTKATANTKDTRLLAVRDVLGSAVSNCRNMGAPDDAAFTAAIEAARDRGAVTYDNVMAALGTDNLTDAARAQRQVMAALAADGHSSGQIGRALGIATERVVELARRYGVAIPADDVLKRTPRIDPARIITEVIAMLDGAGSSARLVTAQDIEALDRDQCRDWARELFEHTKYVLQVRRWLDDRGTGKDGSR